MTTYVRTRPCYGINPRTGKRVGERHRYVERGRIGPCKFCGRYVSDLTYKVKAGEA